MPTPRISIVVPTYNVAAYLPAFLESLRRQSLPLERIEMVFVIDGATDDSESLIRAWTGTYARHATIISKPNGGLASARNVGLDAATAEWVNFCDPDDEFNRDYFRTVLDFLESPDAARVHLAVTRLLILDDATGAVTDTHPLGFKFRHGQRLVDLTETPSWIHMQAASAFYRRARLDELGLRFDADVRPNFEDSYLTTLYLASYERPTLAMLPGAQYRYRHRADGTSLVQSSWAKPEKYAVLPQVGYLRLLETVQQRLGRIPEWVQNLVLYDLFFYFRTDGRSHSPTAALASGVTDTFLATVTQIAEHLDADVIERYAVWQPKPELLAVLTQGIKQAYSRPRQVVRGPRDSEQCLVRVRYHFTGALPVEVFTVDGVAEVPAHAKIRSVDYFQRTLLYERIVWLPARSAGAAVLVELDGQPVPVVAAREPDEPRPPGGASALSRRVRRVRTVAEHVRERVREDPRLLRQRGRDVVIRARSRQPAAAGKFADAWLLIDRDSSAQDNAEHLYRHLREHEPDVNSWFVLRRDSTDWNRLQREGFRLIEFGSTEFFVAVLHCAHIISSQIDHYVAAPTAGRRLRKDGWRLTFLQHGVTKDDLSRWINLKPLDLMITATPDEQQSIAGDRTPYVFTTREIRMTGFPRHDRLLALGRQHEHDCDLLLVMPTWRRELLGDTTAGGNDRALVDGFWDTAYARQWRTLLESPRLRELAERTGRVLTFVPHPNMQDYLDTSPLPDHVRVHRFRDVDVQDVLARAAVLVTDYSSMAFEVAYLDRPVVYFQFDQDQFFAGGHAYRRGTWSYAASGFGPVTVDVDAAIDAIAAALEGNEDADYPARRRHTFPLRDGQCCERTAAAIRGLRQPDPAVLLPAARNARSGGAS